RSDGSIGWHRPSWTSPACDGFRLGKRARRLALRGRALQRGGKGVRKRAAPVPRGPGLRAAVRRTHALAADESGRLPARLVPVERSRQDLEFSGLALPDGL